MKLEALARPWLQENHEVFQIRFGKSKAFYSDACTHGLGAMVFDDDNVKIDDEEFQPNKDSLLKECFFQFSMDATKVRLRIIPEY